ncbi:single-stranded DNA-binding protein, partial [Kitasatospora sp. LaBMicrA B282]|uniref:single-stranded DNA-binding protein n=1 Tax=Kitasatospora sp. LaBMicrA B282 TaxID=3420949 RepID=UPI003D11AB47
MRGQVVNETLVTMIGNVASAVSYGQTGAGVPTANFRLAATERRYDRTRGEWVDGETNWVTVTAWRWLATNVVSSLNKGDPVVVCGRLRIREWEDDGKRRTAVEVDARSVGHDLGRGTSAFRWAVRGRSEVEPSVGEAVPEWIVTAIRDYRASGGAGGPGGAGGAGGAVGVGGAVVAGELPAGGVAGGAVGALEAATAVSDGADANAELVGSGAPSHSPAARAVRAARAGRAAGAARAG